MHRAWLLCLLLLDPLAWTLIKRTCQRGTLSGLGLMVAIWRRCLTSASLRVAQGTKKRGINATKKKAVMAAAREAAMAVGLKK